MPWRILFATDSVTNEKFVVVFADDLEVLGQRLTLEGFHKIYQRYGVEEKIPPEVVGQVERFFYEGTTKEDEAKECNARSEKISKDLLTEHLGKQLFLLRKQEIDTQVFVSGDFNAADYQKKQQANLVMMRMNVQEIRRALGIEPMNLGEDPIKGLTTLLIKLLPTDELIRLSEHWDGDSDNSLLDLINSHLMEVVPEIFNKEASESMKSPVRNNVVEFAKWSVGDKVKLAKNVSIIEPDGAGKGPWTIEKIVRPINGGVLYVLNGWADSGVLLPEHALQDGSEY